MLHRAAGYCVIKGQINLALYDTIVSQSWKKSKLSIGSTESPPALGMQLLLWGIIGLILRSSIDESTLQCCLRLCCTTLCSELIRHTLPPAPPPSKKNRCFINSGIKTKHYKLWWTLRFEHSCPWAFHFGPKIRPSFPQPCPIAHCKRRKKLCLVEHVTHSLEEDLQVDPCLY